MLDPQIGQQVSFRSGGDTKTGQITGKVGMSTYIVRVEGKDILVHANGLLLAEEVERPNGAD